MNKFPPDEAILYLQAITAGDIRNLMTNRRIPQPLLEDLLARGRKDLVQAGRARNAALTEMVENYKYEVSRELIRAWFLAEPWPAQYYHELMWLQRHDGVLYFRNQKGKDTMLAVHDPYGVWVGSEAVNLTRPWLVKQQYGLGISIQRVMRLLHHPTTKEAANHNGECWCLPIRDHLRVHLLKGFPLTMVMVQRARLQAGLGEKVTG
jgi:hypothetical protein